MERVTVDLGDRSYEIVIGPGILDALGDEAIKLGTGEKMAIVSNPKVFGLYGERVRRSLAGRGFNVGEVIIPDGEIHKNMDSVDHILTELLKMKLDRSSVVVALGGGVIGDIACFAASLYMRGIACLQVPTTLLSQVDSSVGGKTGVNHELGKNMIGTFYQPSLVWIDIDVLQTLERREVLAGIAEVIKYGVIRDQDLFSFMKKNTQKILELDPDSIVHIIKRSCEIKADIVSEDEREAGVRAILNFGHTIGHALETLTGYDKLLHGEAVSIGMCYEAILSNALGKTGDETVREIKSIVEDYGLPSGMPEGIAPGSIMDTMMLDKKAVGGSLRFILPDRIGSVSIEKDIDKDYIIKVLRA